MGAGACSCPKLRLEEWRDREVTLAGHAFLARPTPLFLHLPHRLYRDLGELQAAMDGVRCRAVNAPMVMHRDGWFAGEVLVSVEPPAEGAPGVRTFQNLFYSRVVGSPGFDAALRAMPRFYRDLRAAQVGPIGAMYFWYINCPSCLIGRGAGQVILMACSDRLLVGEEASSAAAPCVRGRFVPCGA